MDKSVNKSLEYISTIDNEEYKIKVLIVSAPEELEIINIDNAEYEGYIYIISVSTEPYIPIDGIDQHKNLIYMIGSGDNNRFGYMDGDSFIDFEKNGFILGISARILEVLMIAGDTGHFLTR